MGKPKGSAKPEGSGKQKGVKINQLTDLDYQGLVEYAMELHIDQGLAKHTITKLLKSEKGLSVHQCQTVFERLFEKVKEYFGSKMETSLENSIARLNKLYELAIISQDPFTALNVIKEINKISGLYVTKVEVGNAMTIPDVIELVEVLPGQIEDDGTEEIAG